MKIRFSLFLFILLICNQALKSQKTVSDTLAYVKKFEINKEKYIGKPFSLLLKDMTLLQPKNAKSDISEDPESPLQSTMFMFSDKNISSANGTFLIIKWKADAIPNTPIEFFEQEHNYRFTLSERNFFEKKVVKDIVVYKK
ncbi:hypothetical protein SAMN05880574_12038 [Chryseobacterium sp. RU37D]|uniref:hypothetical protein n=1 Tax=Chryseobacterium sp. RU37D TaxID=1907397 RepID=UPI0009556C52|nr:hypothetical protein [Chryseobacterium sp. RU37D]SIQ67597.1 hypothetical protein SAMN05880574_12038 [Chryseobacterium sp. RU37D]